MVTRLSLVWVSYSYWSVVKGEEYRGKFRDVFVRTEIIKGMQIMEGRHC